MSVWCSRSGIYLFTTLLLLLLLTTTTYAFPNDTINEIPDSYLTLASGNSLWTDLILNCKKPSLPCIQKNVYEYLHGVLNSKDIQLTDGIRISRHSAVNFSEGSTAKTDGDDFEDAQVGRSSSFGDIAAALHNNLIKFMVTHDFEFDLPDVFFEGATLQLSPRAFEKDGALVKVDLVPKKEVAVPEGRILFKKIKKFISEKLVIALLAIVLVIKLIAVKFLFMLPMIMGVAAAKKLLLKVLLFLFPVLSHLFKLCPYYSPTKYHQHNHHISHIHHLPSLHHGSHDLEHLHHDHGHHHDSSNFEYYSDGPAFSDYHRKTFDAKGKKPAEENEVGWGSGQGQPFKRGTKFSPTGNRPLTPGEIENMIQKAEQEATLKARLQEEQKRVENENKRLQDQIKQSLKLQEKLKLQSIIVKQNSKLVAANILQSANVVPTHVIPTQHVVHAVPATTYLHPPMMQTPNHPVYHHQEASSLYSTTVGAAFDPFYSPILEKMDKILIEMGYNDEPCRERVICSMYKNPNKYSPHSNLLSAELSRDPSELQKPTSSNAAVVRFYTYVQAARDGQDNRDCLRLYPTCPINTEL